MSTLIERFLSNVEKSKSCWLWIGPTKGPKEYPYGAFSVGAHSFLAHRISYELFVGEVPGGLQVLHSCDISLCVYPKHLFTGTQKDNIRDMISKARFIPPYGEKCGTSKLTWREVREIRAQYGSKSIACLARNYHVSAPTIHSIVHRKKWKHDPEDGGYGKERR